MNGSHFCSAADQRSAVTEPVESSRSPPNEMMSPLPSSVADGYQWPSFRSLVLLYVSVTGSKMYESLYPSYPCPPATGNALLPLITSTRPSASWT